MIHKVYITLIILITMGLYFGLSDKPDDTPERNVETSPTPSTVDKLTPERRDTSYQPPASRRPAGRYPIENYQRPLKPSYQFRPQNEAYNNPPPTPAYNVYDPSFRQSQPKGRIYDAPYGYSAPRLNNPYQFKGTEERKRPKRWTGNYPPVDLQQNQNNTAPPSPIYPK